MEPSVPSSLAVTALRDVTTPHSPLRVAEPLSGEAAARKRLVAARAELDYLEGAYDAALRRGMSAHDRGDIAAAFDEADALQRRLLQTVHRTRKLERELTQLSTATVLAHAAAPGHPADAT
jgi:hypothetical protein